MDSLSSKKTPGDIRKALKSMPRGIKGLETLYNQAMERIYSQDEDSQELAKKVLSWITHAKRPLKTSELQHALAVEVGTTELDEDFLPEVDDMVSVCAGLVTIDEQGGIVRWIHYTTQEYFARECDQLFPQAQLDIAKICTTYISFDTFTRGFCKDESELKERLETHTLYDYATKDWGHHVCAAGAPADFEQWLLEFAESESKMAACYQAAFYNAGGSFIDGVQRITGMHFVAIFGLRELAAILIRIGHDPDSKDSEGRTPLSWAARRGHAVVVELLLATGSVNPNTKDRWMRTTLQFASFKGYITVVELLLGAGADLNAKGGHYGNALQAASAKGHTAIVELLIDRGAEVNAQGGYYGNALQVASAKGHTAIAELLLSVGANVNVQGGYYGNALQAASAKGHTAIVELLLSVGANVNVQGGYYGNALQAASAEGHTAIVELLLAAGADVNAQGGYHSNALQAASSDGHTAVFKLLLAAGADVNAQGGYYGNALQAASAEGHTAIFELLLCAGADVNKQGRRGNFLNGAAYEGRTELLHSFLSGNRSSQDLRDNQGRSALHLAARGGQISTIDCLLAFGIEINAMDKRGDQVVSYAASGASTSVLQRILQHPNFHSEKTDGWSPIHWACRIGGPEVLQLLIDYGYQGHVVRTSQPEASWTPYSIAMFHGNRKLVSESGSPCSDSFTFDSTLPEVVQGFAEGVSSTVAKSQDFYYCDGCEHVSILYLHGEPYTYYSGYIRPAI
jgi:ankyrin repeat protein